MQVLTIGAGDGEKRAVPATLVRAMHELLGANMTAVLGGPEDWRGNPAFARWRDEVFLGAEHHHTRHIVLLDGAGLRAFLSFTAPCDGSDLVINELQVRRDRWGDGATLRRLVVTFAELVAGLPHEWLITYANDRNARSRSLLERAGFEAFEATERGQRYRLPRRDFVARFGGTRAPTPLASTPRTVRG